MRALPPSLHPSLSSPPTHVTAEHLSAALEAGPEEREEGWRWTEMKGWVSERAGSRARGAFPARRGGAPSVGVRGWFGSRRTGTADEPAALSPVCGCGGEEAVGARLVLVPALFVRKFQTEIRLFWFLFVL